MKTRELVVVVEDDVGVRQALQRLLLARGYAARTFDSAEALIAAGGSRDARCLVLDVRLGDASGVELYARLGSDRPPAVFITAHDSPQLRSTLQPLGASVLPKPFRSQELMDAIARAIGSG